MWEESGLHSFAWQRGGMAPCLLSSMIGLGKVGRFSRTRILSYKPIRRQELVNGRRPRLASSEREGQKSMIGEGQQQMNEGIPSPALRGVTRARSRANRRRGQRGQERLTALVPCTSVTSGEILQQIRGKTIQRPAGVWPFRPSD